MKNLKDQLAGIAALIAAIIAIGGGFVKYGEITTRLNALTIASKTVDVDYASQIAVIEEKVKALETADTSHSHNTSHSHSNTEIKVLQTEIKLLKVQMEEIKISTSNPLSQ